MKTVRVLLMSAVALAGFSFSFGEPVNAAAPDTGPACTYLDAGTNSTKACVGVTSDSRSCRQAVLVTPSDITDLTVPARALYVGGAGTVSVYFVDDTVGVAVNISSAANQWHPVWVRRVLSTGTGATNILACIK